MAQRVDGAQVASQVLDQAGQFAFIFPGAGQVLGAALSFMGGLLGLAADQPADPGPSLADLDDDIKAVADLVKVDFEHLEAKDYRTLLRIARDAQTTLTTTFEEIAADTSKLVQSGEHVPPALAAARQLDLDLRGGGIALSQACAAMTTLDGHHFVRALTLYCDTRTRLHDVIQKSMFIYQAAMQLNHDRHGKHGESWPVPDNWWQADILAAPLQTSLRGGIADVHDTLVALRASFASRKQRVEAAAAATTGVPAIVRKTTWDQITHDEYLDEISEATVDRLLGTPERMGVVELWQESLEQLYGEYTGGKPFARGDKLDPVRTLPTCWLNADDTALMKTIATGGAGDPLAILTQKQSTVLSDVDRPFVGALRSIDPKQPMLTIVVVNASSDPLVLAELPAGAERLVSKPVVATYPARTRAGARPTAGFTATDNGASADPTSWIEAAPVGAMGAGSSAVGVWQFALAPSQQAVTAGLRFGLRNTIHYGSAVVAELRTDRHNNVAVSADNLASLASYLGRAAGLGQPSDEAIGCVGVVQPHGGTTATNDVVVTVYISDDTSLGLQNGSPS